MTDMMRRAPNGFVDEPIMYVHCAFQRDQSGQIYTIYIKGYICVFGTAIRRFETDV